MRTPKLLHSLLFSLFVCGGSAAAHAAAMPDFAGNCTRETGSNTVYCDFDALRDTEEANPSTCPGSTIHEVNWNFGDNNPGQGSSVSWTYYDVHLTDGSVTVTVWVTCADSTWDLASRHVVFTTISCGRCINVNNGWD